MPTGDLVVMNVYVLRACHAGSHGMRHMVVQTALLPPFGVGVGRLEG